MQIRLFRNHAAALAALILSILGSALLPNAHAQLVIPAAQAVATNVPQITGDGVWVEIFPNVGGGGAPQPSALEGLTPIGSVLCPKAYFGRSAAQAGTNSLERFFDDVTYLPGNLRGLNVSNFILRMTALFQVTRDLDKNRATPEIDLGLYISLVGGLHCRVGELTVTNAYRTSSGFLPPIPLAFETEGLYPITLLYAADSNRAATLQLWWQTSGGTAIIPTDVLYQRVDPADRLVNFDTSPASSGARLTNQFQNLGLLFRTLSGDLQATSAKPGIFVPVTPSRVYGDPSSNAAPGELEFWFVEPGGTNASTSPFVDFYVIGATGSVVTAYDPSNAVLFAREYHGGLAARERVTIDHPAIARVKVTLGAGNQNAAIDRLAFRTPNDAPDLRITSLEAPTQVVAGEQFPVRWSVQNAGNRPAQGSWLDYFRHSPDRFEGQDYYLFYERYSGELAPGAGFTRTNNVVITAQYAGLRYLVGRTDSDDTIVETNEANNLLVRAVPIEVLAPDVALEQVVAPAAADLGAVIPVNWTWRNVGTAPVASGTRWLEYVDLSTNAAGANATRLLSYTHTVNRTVAPAETYTVTTNLTLPLRTDVPAGNYFLIVKTPQSWSGEPTATNNTLAKPITLTQPPLPDLAVTALTAPLHLEAGQPIQVRWTVTNHTDHAAPGPWTETVYLSTDSQPGGDTAVDSFVFTGGLGPHQSVERVQTIVVPGSLAGQRWFVVTVDSADVLPETGPLENNSRAAAAASTIVAADLVVTSWVYPSNAQYGQTANLVWTVRNSGTATAQTNWTETIAIGGGNLGGYIQLASVDRLAPLDPGASYTRTQSVTFPLQSYYQTANLTLALKVDALNKLAESNEANNQTNSLPIAFTLPQLPDLAVVSITAPANALPGQTVPLAWVVTNRGNATAEAPWTERVFLSADASPGSDRLLATFTLNNPLAAGASAMRSQPVVVPQGISGDQWFVVQADSTAKVVESDEGNNYTVAPQPTRVAAALSLTLNQTSVPENAGTNALLASLQRNTGFATNLVVTLTNSDPTAATVPEMVTIPAGEAAVVIPVVPVVDNRVDGPQAATLTASASDFASASATFTVTDSDSPQLSLLLPSPMQEGAGGMGILSRNGGTNQPLVVWLWSDAPWRVRFNPYEVTIPAGAWDTSFVMETYTNDFFEGTVKATVYAASSNYPLASAALEILDDDVTLLGLELASTTLTESGGGAATVGTVTRFPVTSRAMAVSFATERNSPLVNVPRVIIPAYQAAATFNVFVRDDDLVNGTRTNTLTARIVNDAGDIVATNQASVLVTVLDDDGPSLGLDLRRAVVREGGSVEATISRNTAPTGPLVVHLSSSDPGEATLPATVTLLDGQASASVTVQGVPDGVSDGLQTVTLTATADGFNPAVAELGVTDIDLPDLIVTRVDAPKQGLTDEYVTVTWSVTNNGLVAVSGSWTDYLLLPCTVGCQADALIVQTNFTGTLAVGEGYTRSAVVRLPSEPGEYRFRVFTDAERAVMEGAELNNLRASDLVAVQPAYHALAWTEVDAAPNGTEIPIQGRAWLTRDTNAPAAFKPVRVQVSVKRIRRDWTVMTDASGAFQTVFTPLPTEAGFYDLGADFPSRRLNPVQDHFTLLGLKANPDTVNLRLVPGDPLSGTVSLLNLGNVPLTGLTASAPGLPAGLEVTFALTNRLEGDATATLTYAVTATGTNAAKLEFQIHVASAEGVFTDVPVKVMVVPLRPELVANPPYLERGMVRGQQALVTMELSNQGGAPTGPLNVLLPAASWLSLSSAAELPSLNPGDKTTVTLRLSPADDLPLTPYNGNLVVAGPAAGLSMPFQFRALSEGRGDLHVKVEDEYTYYVEGAPLVTNATVALRDAFTGETLAEGNTGEAGEVWFTNVLEGTYTLEVLASRHAPYRGTVTIQPGIVNEAEAFIRRETVVYRWRVVPAEIEDHYRLVLESEFEANVPIPNVIIENPELVPLVTPGYETQITIHLRNEGLIAANNVQFLVPNSSEYLITPLITQIGTLPAKSRISVPVLVRHRNIPLIEETARGNGRGPKDEGDCEISAHDCLPPLKMPVIYYYVCKGDQKELRVADFRPLCTPKKVYDCLSNLKDSGESVLDSLSEGEPPWDAGCDVAAAVLDCFGPDMPPCAKWGFKAACKVLVGAATGGAAGAVGGAAGSLGDGLGCLCELLKLLNVSFDTELSGGSPQILPGFGFTPGLAAGWMPGEKEPDCGDSGGSPSPRGPKDPDPKPAGVCARVRIRIEQSAVMTRAAFVGTLEIENGGDNRLNQIQVDLEFRDDLGNTAADKFAVRGPQLTGLSDVTGGGQLNPTQSGSARFTFIPTRDAAPDAPAIYHIGGTLRYVEAGQEIVVPLLASPIVVLPEARMVLQYFQQRDVFSDDPFTDEVEPAEPFVLGLLAKNQGAGWARNFRITSAQPRIVENEKGLLIDFKIIGTRVGSNAVAPSLTADLGFIAPGGTQVAQWLLTSSLQGKFLDYTATFEHVDAMGHTNLSLIESVEIHELIRAVQADRPGDDGLTDFLTNEDPDPEDFPDRLFLSDGTIAVVNRGVNPAVVGSVRANNLQVRLTANMSSGWCYFHLPDPGARFALRRVVRSDGKELRVGDNVWQTDRTFPSSTYGVEREWRLHLLDFNGTGDYTLHYRVNDTEPPSVVEVRGPVPALQSNFIAAVDVVFSEPVDLATFGPEDLALRLNGGENLLTGDITIDLVTNATYRVGGLAAFTAEDGNYKFTVLGGGIADYAGHAVTNSASCAWAKGEHAAVVVSVGPVLPNPRTTPATTVDVTFSRAIAAATFDLEDLALSLDGGLVGWDESVTITPLSTTSFRIAGLDAFTAGDGSYRLTVAASGVQDTLGNSGAGALTQTWTKDGTPPVIVDLEDVPTNPRNIVVMSLDVTFSEPVAPASFDWQDLTLRRDNGLNLITSEVTVTPLGPAVFRIANFNWVCGEEGEYQLAVNASGVTDLAGNPGVGVVTRSWVMDTTPPAAPFNLSLAPDTGISASDRLVNTNRLVVSGQVNATNVTARVYDLTQAHDLGEAAVVNGQFSRPIELTGAGEHRLRVRAVDAAGNTSSDAFLTVRLDLSPPVIALDPVTPDPRTNSVSQVIARFSEGVDTNFLNWAALTLTRNGGTNLVASNTVALHLVASNVVQIAGLASLTAEVGDYAFIVWPRGVVDLAGNPAVAAATNTWRVVGQNTAPRLLPIPVQTVAEGSWLTFPIGATDADIPAQRLTFSLEGSLPAGVTLHPTSGLFSWRPTEAQGPGAYVFTARVRDDGLPPLSDFAEFTVLVSEVNLAPVIAPVPEQLVFESFTLSLPIRATDADLPPNLLHFVLASNAPAGLTLGLLDGVLTWTPTEAQCDTTNHLTVLVSDNGMPNLTAARTITVVAQCLKPGLNLPRRAPAGGWEFTFKGEVGHDYRIETSDDLREWHPLFPITATNRIFTVTDPDPILRLYRYYRAVQQ